MRDPSARSTSRNTGARARFLGALATVTVLVTGCVLTGCGGDDSESIATATNDDRLALEKVTSEIVDAARNQDAGAFCDLVQPSLMDAAFGSRNACVRVSRSAMAPASPLADLEITDLVTDGDGAIVTYSEDPPGQVLFARENGNWYIALDELARARKEAMKKGNQTQDLNQGGGSSAPDQSGNQPG